MIAAYTALHYGLDYLSWAIESVIDYVDEYHVLYSSQGSHGFRTNIPCPESRHDLRRAAIRAAGEKLRWHESSWHNEGAQRDTIFRLCPHAETIVVLDADEIWQPGLLPLALEQTRQIGVRNIRIPMWHYWRSLYRAVTNDPAYPIRIIYPHISGGEFTFNADLRIDHMGYAQNSQVVHYKQHTHGHRAEWRANWYETKFQPNAQHDVHPTNENYWYPVDVQPPELLKYHPYTALEVIP